MDMKYTSERCEDLSRHTQAMIAAVDMAAGQSGPVGRKLAAEAMRWMREASGLLMKASGNMRAMHREAERDA